VDKDYSQTLKGSHNELGLNIYHHRKEKQINNTHFQIYTKKKKTYRRKKDESNPPGNLASACNFGDERRL
jgi:hypothetical protein